MTCPHLYWFHCALHVAAGLNEGLILQTGFDFLGRCLQVTVDQLDLRKLTEEAKLELLTVVSSPAAGRNHVANATAK